MTTDPAGRPDPRKNEVTEVRVFNYPWSGRLGRIARCCISCGTTGSAFRLSSRAAYCLECLDKEPNPELVRQYEQAMDAAVRSWCLERDIDYEATIAAYAREYGPIYQNNPPRVQQQGEDYVVYLMRKVND